MGTSQSRPLELIYEEFSKALDCGDTEWALDLMAMAYVAAWNTRAQTERIQLLHLVRMGYLRAEGADIRRDLDFEAAVLRFIIGAAAPLAGALSPLVGASLARRRGWIDAWWRLAYFHPVASDADAVRKFYRAVDGYLDDPTGKESQDGFVALANQVGQEFEGVSFISKASDVQDLLSSETSPGSAECEESYEDPHLIDEFDSFLEGRETAKALNLLAVAALYTDYVGLDGDDQPVPELLTRSAGLVCEVWDDSTELSELLSRLWTSAYTELREQLGDESLVDLKLPEFESELPPLSEAQQQVWDSSVVDQVVRPGEEATQGDERMVDDEDDAPEEEVDDAASNDVGDEDEPLVLKVPLIAAAFRHLHGTCGSWIATDALAAASVDAGQQAWEAHATISGSWKRGPLDTPGYGSNIRADLAQWAATTAAEMFPIPVDKRPLSQKRARRFYESFWAWVITTGTLAAIAGVHEGFWMVVGVGALIGYVLSSNYDSITAPRLVPLPDANAKQREDLEKALIDVGLHVALQYDSAAYSLDLSAGALKQMVNGVWQPQGAPPPRMSSCTHREAEFVAAQWMRYLGATSCTATQASRDGGMDIVSDTHVAEVKHHQSPVGVSFIRQIFGAATGASKKAAFFSLNGYTTAGVEFANSNLISLFRYDPQQRTLTAESLSAEFALQNGLHAEMTPRRIDA
jgi:hypothetical protein